MTPITKTPDEIEPIETAWHKKIERIQRRHKCMPPSETLMLRTHIGIAVYVLSTGLTPETIEQHVEAMITEYEKDVARQSG